MIINNFQYDCGNCPHAKETRQSGSFARQYYRCCGLDGEEKNIFDDPCEVRLKEIRTGNTIKEEIAWINEEGKMLKETKDSYEGMLESAISWFEDISEMCVRLTSGNVSHQGCTIRGKAIRAAEYLRKRLKGGGE